MFHLLHVSRKYDLVQLSPEDGTKKFEILVTDTIFKFNLNFLREIYTHETVFLVFL